MKIKKTNWTHESLATICSHIIYASDHKLYFYVHPNQVDQFSLTPQPIFGVLLEYEGGCYFVLAHIVEE